MTPDYELLDRARNFASKVVCQRVARRGGDDWTPLDVAQAHELESAFIASVLNRTITH